MASSECVRVYDSSQSQLSDPLPSPGRPTVHPSDRRLSLTAPRAPARDEHLKGQQLAMRRGRRWWRSSSSMRGGGEEGGNVRPITTINFKLSNPKILQSRMLLL